MLNGQIRNCIAGNGIAEKLYDELCSSPSGSWRPEKPVVSECAGMSGKWCLFPDKNIVCFSINSLENQIVSKIYGKVGVGLFPEKTSPFWVMLKASTDDVFRGWSPKALSAGSPAASTTTPESIRGAVTIRVSRAGEPLVERMIEVELLACNVWGGAGYMSELLADFSFCLQGFLCLLLPETPSMYSGPA